MYAIMFIGLIILMVHSNNIDPYYSFKCGVASFLANYAVGVFHPLQLLKTRLQSHDGKIMKNLVPKYEGIFQGIKQIYKVQGLSGLFKGIHLTTFTAAAASSLFFWIYQKRKLDYEQLNMQIMPATGIASLEASLLTTFITQPFWVIKTRILLNTDNNISQFQNIKHKSIEVWKHHGFRGFYLGLSMNILLSMTGAIQMYIYEGSKLIYDHLLGSTSFGQKNFICGAISKLFSTIITYPLTTIRTRAQQNQYIQSQTQRKYYGSIDIIKKITKQEGLKGFFKGLMPNLIRGIPHRGVYFYFYELFKNGLINQPLHKQNL